MYSMQSDNYSQLILTILEAIDYKDDKEILVRQFIENTHAQTIIDLIQSLPNKRQKEIQKQISSLANNPEEITNILKSEFTEEKIQKAFENAVKNAIKRWMEVIRPSLSENQKGKLLQLAQDLKT